MDAQNLKRKIGLAKSLIPDSDIILLDEPYSNLDSRLKEKIRDQMLHILREYNISALLVTHDPEEAMFMSDRIVVINEGELMQIGRPGDLYNRPKSKFVAEFFGEVNLIPGKIKKGRIQTILGSFEAKNFEEETPVNIIIRHEGIKLIDKVNPDNNSGKIILICRMGSGKVDLILVKSGDKTD